MKTGLFLTGIVLILLAGCQSAPPPTSTPPPPPIATPTLFTGSGRVMLDDIKVYFEVHGDGNPMILLHGGLASTRAWSYQVPIFSEFYRVIALDNRGQGRTTDGDVPISYHLMAEDTVRLMDHLGIETAYIVGWSDGAVIALDLAIHHPERVIALVAYGAHISPDGLQEKVIASLRESSVDDLIGDEHRRLSPRPELLPLIVEKIKTMWLTQPAFTAEELAGIKAPTLIIAGQNEEVVRPDHAAAIAKAIPGAELIILPDVGHYAITEKPSAWNKAVLDFLKDR